MLKAKKNIFRSFIVFLLTLSVWPSGAQMLAGGSCQDQDEEIKAETEEGAQSVAFEIQDGRATVHLPALAPEDVDDILWAGRSIRDEVLTPSQAGHSGIDFSLPVDFRIETPGVLEIRLRSGAVLVRGIPDESALLPCTAEDGLMKARCASTSLYTVSKCGGTASAYPVPYRCCDNNYDGDAKDSSDGNCVWLAWVRAREHGWVVPSTWGNATDWCNAASRTPGWTVSSTPAANTIACNQSLGHVAWVTAVDNRAKTFTVTEQNCKVEPSCFGSGTRSKSRPFNSSWKFIRCSNLSQCGTGSASSINLRGRFIRGLAFASGTLWVLHSAPNVSDLVKIAAISPVDGHVIRESPDKPWNGRGIALANGSLWIVDARADRIHRVDPATFAEISSFPTPGTEPNGIVYDGSSLWLTDPYFQAIYKLTTSGALLGSFSIPNQARSGLEWAGNGMWTNTGGAGLTLYSVQGVQIATITLQRLSGSGAIYDIAFGGGKVFVSNGDTIDIQDWRQSIVPGTSRGTPTGAFLEVGDRFSIAATGLVNTLPPDSGNDATPLGNGYPCTAACLLPSASFGALIGKIGTAGPWFLIGNNLEMEAQGTGQLYLAVDDTISDNNTGQFTAVINWR